LRRSCQGLVWLQAVNRDWQAIAHRWGPLAEGLGLYSPAARRVALSPADEAEKLLRIALARDADLPVPRGILDRRRAPAGELLPVGIGVRSAEKHTETIARKLGVRGRREITIRYLELAASVSRQ
jgi:hypothetical protein